MWTPEGLSQLIRRFRERKDLRPVARPGVKAHAEQMEPRVMLSIAKAIDAGTPDVRPLVFVDAAAASAASVSADADVVTIERGDDAIKVITRELTARQNVPSVSIVSHGAPGALNLGGTSVVRQDLFDKADALKVWSASLAQGAAIELYGCDVASGAQGELFVQSLAKLTGATVAASTDTTGPAAVGANAALEFVAGDASEVKGILSADDFTATLAFSITPSGGTTTHVISGSATVVDSGVSVTASGDTSTTALVRVATNFRSGEDVLAVTYGGITPSFSSVTGILSLTSGGALTAAQWQAVFRAVTFTTATTAPNLSTRGITFTIGSTTSAAKSLTPDLPVDTATQDRIVEALDVVEAIGVKIATFSGANAGLNNDTEVPFTGGLKVTDLFYPNSPNLDSNGNTVTDWGRSVQPHQIGNYLALSDAADTYFNGAGTITDLAGLETALEARLASIVPGTSAVRNVTVAFTKPAASDARSISITVTIANTRGDDIALDLPDLQRDLGLYLPTPPTITVGGGADIEFTISVDLQGHTYGSTLAQNKTTLAFSRLNALAGFTFSNVTTTAEFGLIRGQLVNASGVVGAKIPVSFSGSTSRTLDNWATDGSNVTAFSGTITGSANLDLPVSAAINGVSATTGNSKIVVTDSNIFDTTAPSYTTTDFSQVLYFSTMKVEDVIGEILKVKELYTTLANSDEELFGVNVPFLKDKTLGELFDFGELFDSAIGEKVDIVEPVLNTPGRDALTDYRLPLSEDSTPSPAMWSDLRAGFKFGVVVNDAWPIVTVTVAADNSRNTLDDLVSDVNAALTAASLQIQASNVSGKMSLKATNVAVQKFAVVPVAPDAARLSPGTPPADLTTLTQNQAYYYTVTGTTSGSVTGTNYYTTATPIAAAAVHAGILTNGQSGVVKVTRIGAPGFDLWGGTRNGIISTGASSPGNVYLIESAANDLRRLGIVDYGSDLVVLDQFTEGRVRASMPLTADLFTNAQLVLKSGSDTVTLDVLDYSRTSLADTLTDIKTALASALSAANKTGAVAARLIDENNQVLEGAPESGEEYRLEFYLPDGSAWTTFSVEPSGDATAYRALALGFIVGDVSAQPRPSSLRTFEDFSNGGLFPSLTITPVFDNVAGTVTLQFTASAATTPDIAAGFDFNPDPVGRIKPTDADLEFTPTVNANIAFGVEFKLGPANPIFFASGDSTPANGQLTTDAHFNLEFVLQDKFAVTVPSSWTTANEDIQDLVADINRALKQAVPSGGGTVDLTADRMVARRQLNNDKFELTTATPANGGAAIAISHTDGVLASDAVFTVTYDSKDYIVTLPAADTEDNESFADLVLQLNSALSTVVHDADTDDIADADETTLSLADKLFFTTIATAAGASDSNVYLFAVSPGSTSWPATITLSATRTDSAVTQLGLDDGGSETTSSITARASGIVTHLRNHTNGDALAGGSLAMTLPSFAGSVTYGFNTLDFASTSGGSVAAELEVLIDANADDANSSVIGNDPAAFLARALTGAGGTGNATAGVTLEDITSGSADIDNNAAIQIAIADLSDTTAIVEIPVGVPIPVPGQTSGVLTSNAAVNFLYEGAKYTVTVTAASTTANTSFTDLAADFNAALTSVTRTVSGVPALGFDASSMFTISADGEALLIAAKTPTANPDYAVATFVPGLAAFGEVGLQGAFGPATVAQALADVMPVLDAIQSQMDAFANIPLPLVELVLSDLIDIKGDMLRRIESFRDMSVTTPEQIASALSAAFSIPSDFVSVAFDTTNNAYRVDLKIETGVATEKPLDLTLADFYRFTNDTPPAGLARLVDTGSRSPLTVKIKSTSVLSIGIDLTDPDEPRTFLYGHDGSGDLDLENGTSIQLAIEATSDDISFTAATGAFGVFVRGGNASLGGPVVTSGGQPVYTFDEDTNQLHFARQSDAATLTVTLGGNDGKFYLDPGTGEDDAFDLDNFEAVFEGTAEVNLPMFTPTELMNPFTNRTVNVRIQGIGLTDVNPGGNVMSLHIPDLQAYADHVVEAVDLQNQISDIYTAAGGNPNGAQQTQIDNLTADLVDLKDGGAVEIFTPDVEDANSGIKAPTLLDILRDPAILVDPLDILFGTIETGLRALDNLNIPVIGPALGDAVDDVFGWRTGWLLDLRNNMRGKGEAVFESIKESIYNVLGPNGIDLLLKDNGIRSVDGMVRADSMDDVGLDFLDEDGEKMTGLGGYGAHAVEFKLRLGQTLLDTGTDISFDFDALEPAFTLGISGGLSFKLGWDFTFGFGFHIDDGFYIVTDSNPAANELELRFEAGLRGDQHYFQVAEKSDSPTGYAIKDKDGNWVLGPRKGNGTRDIVNVLPVDETGTPLDPQDLQNVQFPHEICEDDSLSASGPGFDEEVFWVVAAQDGSDWVPAYMDKLGFYRPQQGSTWEAVNGEDEFNPDQMIEYNQTAPFNAYGSLFFLNLSATDKPKIGLGALGDGEYFYDPAAASTITANGRNDADNGVNRNNNLPTRFAGRIGINVKDPSADAGDYVARPGPSITNFILMDGSNVLGGEPVLDDDGNPIPVALNEDDNDTWYTIKPKDGVTNPTTLADYEFDAPITEDPSENRITWGELRQGGTGLFEFVLNAEAVVNLSMVLKVSDNANIPRLTADFNLDWRTDSMKPPANPFDTTTEQKRDLIPEVGLNNIRLDMGSFLTKLIKPIAVEIDKTLKPIDPLISAIQTTIPVISDIAGRPIKLTTLLYTFGGPKGQAVATVIEMAILVRELSGVMANVPSDANIYLPIGNFWLAKISNGPFGQPGMGKTIYYDNSEVSAPSITQRNQSLIAEPGQGINSATTALGKLDAMDKQDSNQPGIGNPQDKGGFNIPILEDPITIFKLLMGEDVPLVTFSLPKLNFSFEQSIPLVRIICFEAGIRLGLQMKGQLAMGYDTAGIRMFKDTGDPADLLQGFYVSDRANADGTGADVDEFWFRASIALYGEIDLYLAKGGIEGGFALTGSVNLNDPNNDGKLRVVEAVDLVKYTGNPLDLADLSLSGEVYARYYYWVGLRIWTPWKTYKITLYSGGKTFARLQLFNISREGNDGPPTFASVVTTVNPDGSENPSTLLIHAGSSAEKRVSNQDPLKALDGAERFRIWNDTPGSSTIKVQYKNWDQNHTQTYNNVSRVVVYGGEYDDYIDASGLSGVPVEIQGGNGNDTILLGSGHATSESIITGGNGNDIITAGGGNLRIQGDGGNDTITAGSGTNLIDPGDGNDTVTGGGSGSTNKVFLRRSFGKDTLSLDPQALVNLLDYVDSTLPLVGTLSGAGSTIYAGDTNVTTFSLGAVTEIKGSEGRDIFNLVNPTTRNANSGKGLILRGHESVDTYNFTADNLSNVASDGITIDDGIRPTATATIGDITLSDPCAKIKEIKVASGGANYATAPEVVITDNDGTGSGARAVASLDRDGKVQGIYVLDGGDDYGDPVVALVDRVSYGDKLVFNSTTTGTVTLDKQGNGGSDYRITSGGKSIKFAGWTTPGTPRGDSWNISETDNVEINVPAGTLELDEHLDIQETFSVTAKRMDLDAAITADTVKITTERGFALDHPIQAVNNGDVSIRVSGKDIGNPADIATATATVVDGAITGITVTNPGAHYDFAPVVAIIDERGYAARAVATINGSGQVTGITVLDGGFGYLSTPAPRVVISPPASIRLATNVSSSTVGSNPGTGDGRGQITLQADLGSIVNMGEVFFPNGSNIEFKHGDFRYKSTDSLEEITTASFPTTAGGQGATAVAVLDADGRIDRIDVTNGGSGYDTNLLPTVIIQGAGTATAIVSGGAITGFKITNPGEGYPSAPTVTILPNGFGKIVGADSTATALNRTHIKSAGGALKAISYYGIGDPAKPIKTDVARMVAQTLGLEAPVNILEKDSVRIGTIDHVNGINTVDGNVAVTTFAGVIHLGQPVQAMNANGQLLWQDAAKTIPIYVRDNAGNIIYEGGRLQTGEGQIKLTADDVDINSFVGATGGQLILQPVKFDAPIGLNGTQARATVSVSGPTGTVSINTLYSGRGYTTTPMVTLPPPGERAYAVANVVNGSVQSAIVTFGGKRYNSTYSPIVTFVGGGANGATPANPATASATYDADGVVTGITITSGGSGYVTAPEMRISLPGVQATAVATVVDGRISGITFTNPGANYAEPPQIKIEAPYQFSLEAEEVQYLQDGFREVVIGRDDGSHTFQAADVDFDDAVRLRAPRTGGTMQVESLSVDDGPVIIVGSGHTLNMTSAAPNVTGTYVEVDDNIIIHDNVNASITATTGHVLIFGVGKGKIDGVANSLTENLTITDVGDVTVTGAIGSTNPINDLTINSTGGGNIALQQSVTIEGDLHIVKGGNITFGGAVVIGGNLIIDEGASVSFNGTVSVGGNMTISDATTVQFAANVTVTGNLLMGNSADPSKLQAVTFANNARLDVDGTVEIYADEDISFGNRVGNTLVPNSITLRSDTGSVSFAAQVFATGNTLTIIKSDDVTFGHDVNVGTLSITAAGETRFNRAVNAGTLNVLSQELVVFSNQLNISGAAGNATITADEVDFAGGSTTIKTVGAAIGNATLTVKPYTAGRNIGIGSPPALFGVMDMNDTDMAAIGTGWAQVHIGDEAAGTGAVTIGSIGTQQGGTISYLANNTAIHGGSITVVQPVDMALSTGTLRLHARTGDVTTNAVLNGTALERGAVVRIEADTGNINLNQPVYATSEIQLIAGGNVTEGVNSFVNAPGLRVTAGGAITMLHASNAVTTVTMIADNDPIQFREDSGYAIGTVNGQTGMSACTGDITLTTIGGAVTQSQAIVAGGLSLQGAGTVWTLTNAANDIDTLTANTGKVSFVDADTLTVGTIGASVGSTTTDDLSIIAGQALTVSNSITTSGPGDVSLTSGNANVQIDAAGDITSAQTIAVTAVTGIASAGDLISAAGGITLTATGGTIGTSGVVTATAGNVGYTATGNVGLTGPVTTVTSGNISLTSSAGAVTTSAAADLLSVGTITISAFSGATLSGDMTAAGAVSATVANGSASIAGATQTTNGAVTFTVQDSLDQVGTITAGGANGNVALTSNGFVVVLQGSAVINAAGTITATAADDVNNMAQWTAGGAIVATATNGSVSNGGNLTSTGASIAFTAPNINNDNPLNAATSVAMTASNFITNDGTITAGTTVTLNGTNSVASHATISAGGEVAITSAAIDAKTSITTTDDNVTFTGPVVLSAAFAIDTGAGAGDIDFSSTIDGPGALTMTAGTGDIDVTGAIGATTRLASLTVVSADQARFGGNVSTTGAQTLTATTVVTNATHDVSTANAAIDINGVLSLENDTRLATNGGAIDLTSVVGNTHNLTLASRSGAITTTGNATGLGIVTLQDDISASTGTVRFQGNFEAQTLTTVGRAYDVYFTGDTTTITNLVTLLTTGMVTFGDHQNDATHFASGVIASQSATNPSSTHLAGTLSTDAALVRLGTTVLDANTVIDTTDAGNGGAVTFTGTVNGTHNLRLNAGPATIDFDAAVGNIAPLGDVLIDTHAGLTADSTFTAASITQTAATGATTFTGAVATSTATGIDLTGLDVTFGSTVTTTTGGVTIDSGDAHFGGVVTSAANLVVTADAVDFDAAVNTAGTTGIDITAISVDFDAAVATTGDGFVNIVATGLVNFDSTVNVASTGGVTIDAADITFDNTVTTPGAVILDHTGTLTIAAAADFNLGGAFSQAGTGAVSTAGDITTTADSVSFNGAVALTGNVAISTAGGDVDFNSALDGTHNLLLTAGAGDITFHASVGDTTPLGAVTIASADDVTLAAGFASANFTQIGGTGTTSVQGLLSTSGIAGVSITAHTIEVTATGDIATAGGPVDLTADTGTLTIADNATVNAGTGTITIESVGDATITGLTTTNATSAAVSITSTTGEIVDGGSATTDITAAANGSVVTLQSVTGIGSQANPLDTRIAVLDADVSGTGDIRILETGAIELRTVTANDGMIDVTAASMTATNVDTADGDLQLITTAGNLGVGRVEATGILRVQAYVGAIVDTAVSGTDGVFGPDVHLQGAAGIGTSTDAIEVTTNRFSALVANASNATTNGGIYLATTTLSAPSVLAEEVVTGTGDVVLTHTAADLEAGLFTTTDGSIDITVTGGSLTATNLIAGGSGDVALVTATAGEAVLVGSVIADGSDITITSAGDILEVGDFAGEDLVASSLTLSATGAIGDAANPIEINADSLSAEADGIGGGIFLTEADDVTVNKLVASGEITLAAGGIIALNSLTPIRSDENLNGSHAAVSRDIAFLGAVELVRDTTIQTGNASGNVRFADTLRGANDLTIAAGNGAIDFDGVVGTSVNPVASITVSNASVVTFADDAYVGTGGLDLTAATGITFDGDTTVTGDVAIDVNNAGNTGALNVNGDFTTTNGGDFIVDHDGTATFADGIVFDIAGDTRFVGTGRVEFGELTYNTGGDIEFNQGPLVLTSNTVIDTGTGGGDVIFRDAVSGGYELTILGSGGDVLFEQAAGTTGSPLAELNISGANAVTFQQGVVVSGDIEITTTGAVTFAQSLASGASIDIATSGLVAFSDQVTAATGLVVNAGMMLTFTETVTVSSGLTELTHGGTLTIPTGANFLLGGEFHERGAGPVVLGEVSIITTNDDITFDGNITLTADAAFKTGNGPGDVTFNGSINGNHEILVLAGQGDVTFAAVGQTTAVGAVTVDSGAVTLAGDFRTATNADLTLTGTGDITFAEDVAVSTGGTPTITTSAGFVMEDGSSLTAREGDNIVITADDVALDGGNGSITGTGLLVVQPFTTDGDIVIGTPGGVSAPAGGTLDLGDDEIDAFGTGFQAVLIGRGSQGGFDSGDAGGHVVTIHDATFASNLFVRATGEAGEIRVEGSLRGDDDVYLNLYAGGDVLIDGLVRATGTGDITIYADVNSNGVGAVRVAEQGDATIRVQYGDILLTGESVFAGSEDGAATIKSDDGTVHFQTDAIIGQIFVFNDRSVVSAGIDVLVGSPDDFAESPSFVRIEGTMLAGRHIRAHSRGPVELGNFRLRSRGLVSVLADGDLRMENGTAVAQGGPATLVADANADGLGTPIESDVRVSETGDVNLGMRVNSVKVKGTLSAGDKGKAWVTVTNNGTATIEHNIRVLLYASLDAELDASDALIGQYAKVLKLKPGQSKRVSFAIQVPLDLEPGDYRMIGEVLPYRADRPAAAAPATADDPNVDASSLVIRVRRPDLVATSVRSSFDGGTFAPGRSGKVTIAVANQGQVPSVGSGTVILYATPNGTFGSAIEIGRVSTSLAIKAGKSKAVNLKVTLPNSLAGGRWQWLAVVNPDAAIAESDHDNNMGLAGDDFGLAA